MIEVLKQMLKALESATVDCSNFHHAKKDQNHHLGECPPVIRWHHAIQAGKKAIAELESQEPVAWMFQNDETCRMTFVESQQLERGWEKENQRYKKIGPLYTHPPQRTESASDYERGVIDGMQKQAQSSVDKAVNAMAQRTWVGLTDEEIQDAGRFSYCRGGTSEKLYHIMWNSQPSACIGWSREELIAFTKAVEAKYQEKNQ